MVVAYLSAEIGLWSELHTYSGGLGVLAGDHIKSAADAGINLVATTTVKRESKFNIRFSGFSFNGSASHVS